MDFDVYLMTQNWAVPSVVWEWETGGRAPNSIRAKWQTSSRSMTWGMWAFPITWNEPELHFAICTPCGSLVDSEL